MKVSKRKITFPLNFREIIFDAESASRKNVIFLFTFFIGILGIYFTTVSINVSKENGDQQKQINELKTIAKHNSDQLDIMRKNHSNDSFQLFIAFISPNLARIEELNDKISNSKIMTSWYDTIYDHISRKDIEKIDLFEADVNELLSNPIVVMHPKEKSELLLTKPSTKNLKDTIDMLIKGMWLMPEPAADEEKIKYDFSKPILTKLKREFEKLRQKQLRFSHLVSTYVKNWELIKPE